MSVYINTRLLPYCQSTCATLCTHSCFPRSARLFMLHLMLTYRTKSALLYMLIQCSTVDFQEADVTCGPVSTNGHSFEGNLH